MINKIAVIVAIILFLFIFIGNVKGEEIGNIKHEKTALLVIQSMMQEPDKWLADEYRMYYYKDKEALKFARKTEPKKTTATLAIWIANGVDHIEIQKPFKYKFSKEHQKQIWNVYQRWAEHQFVSKDFKHLTKSIFDKKVQAAQIPPTFKVPIKEEAKDVLIEIKTKPKKVIEREQNNKGIVLMVAIFILVGIETFFLIGLFISKNFRQSVFRDNG